MRASGVEGGARRGAPSAILRYVRSVWSGEAPLKRLIWTDMLAVGTLVNIVALLASLPLFAAGAPTVLALAVYFSPLPYNFLVVSGIWRSAEREAPDWAWLLRGIAVAWLFIVILV